MLPLHEVSSAAGHVPCPLIMGAKIIDDARAAVRERDGRSAAADAAIGQRVSLRSNKIQELETMIRAAFVLVILLPLIVACRSGDTRHEGIARAPMRELFPPLKKGDP